MRLALFLPFITKTMTIENIENHMAYTCKCGGVNFALLKSGAIECNLCSTPLDDVKWWAGGMGAQITRAIKAEAERDQLRAQLEAQGEAVDTESVLIEGIAYTVPVAVAAEMLRLHLENMGATQERDAVYALMDSKREYVEGLRSALVYHMEQTRPIQRSIDALATGPAPAAPAWSGDPSTQDFASTQPAPAAPVVEQAIYWQYRMRPEWSEHWGAWKECSKESFGDYQKVMEAAKNSPVSSDWIYEVRELVALQPTQPKGE